MSILDRAIQDVKRITGNSNEFARVMTFTALDDSTITTKGLHSKHHLNVDGEGNVVSSKTAYVSVSEENMTGYPLRTNGEVDLKGHRVSVKDSTGSTFEYRIIDWYPDETVGLIVCILQDYD